MLNKVKILVHICCGPDATAVFEQLSPDYEFVGFFHNPNIFPEEEYFRRLQEVKKVSQQMDFELDVPPYLPNDWFKAISGLELEPERGKRCKACFCYTLRATAARARELGISIITSTLTISPHKPLEMVVAAGKTAAAEFGREYLAKDFKKENGFQRSLEISKEMELYRQNYCGCKFSQRVHPYA